MAKREVMFLYGEKTVQVNYRVPESKKDEIDLKFKVLLKGYENPQRVEIDVKESADSIDKIVDEMITQDMSSRIDKILEKKSNPADIKFKKTTESSYDCDQTKRFDMDESAMFPKPTLDKWNSVVPKKIEPQVVDDKIEYEIIDSFPLGIEKFEDFGKNKAIYFYDPDYYTRVINEKAKHISYESADNYLKSK